jgi:hypothetical protein
MFFQTLSFICILFFISVIFYKQRRNTVEILQSEYSGLDSLKELVTEHQPIIIRNTPIPQSLTTDQLSKMDRLGEFQFGENSPLTLRQYLTAPQVSAGAPLITNRAAQNLSKELALPIWVSHTIQDAIQEMGGFFGIFYSQRIQPVFGGIGMQRATAVMTFFLPVEGTYTISLVSPKSESFLPNDWKYRYPDTLTINDSPLVAEIKYIDIILRPGTMICLPAQTIFSMESNDAAFHSGLWIEVDSPVSNLAKFLEDLE